VYYTLYGKTGAILKDESRLFVEFLYYRQVAFIFFIYGYFTELELFTLVSGGLGLVSLLISGLLSGVFIRGNQIRANAAIEKRDEGMKRKRGMYVFALIGTPSGHSVDNLILKYYICQCNNRISRKSSSGKDKRVVN
jgi:hypothetical protein